MQSHRGMLFAFLGDSALTQVQRAVGVVLILRTDGWRKFGTSKRPINWEKISLLSGYSEAICEHVLCDLVAQGWIEVRPDGGYQVAPARIEAAAQRQREHDTRIKDEQRARRREKAEQASPEAVG